MGHIEIERKTLRWGNVGKFPTIGTVGRAMSIPGPSALGNGMCPPADATALAAYLAAAATGYGNQVLPLPRKHGASPIAVSIAPDSAIYACDLSLGGSDGESQRHRISPGNPLLLGCSAPDSVTVSLPTGIPVMTQPAGWALWDTQGISVGGSTLYGFPLRLEVWYGDTIEMLPRSPQRAPYYARGFFNLVTSESRYFVVCVDGRRRIDISLYSFSGAGVTTVSAHSAFVTGSIVPYQEGANWIQLPLLDDGSTTDTVTGFDTGKTWSFNGNPMSLIRFTMARASNDSLSEVRITAWDE